MNNVTPSLAVILGAGEAAQNQAHPSQPGVSVEAAQLILEAPLPLMEPDRIEKGGLGEAAES